MANPSSIFPQLFWLFTILLALISTAQAAKVGFEKGGQVSFGGASEYGVAFRHPQGEHVIDTCGCHNIDPLTSQHPCARIDWEGTEERVYFYDLRDCQLSNETDILYLQGRKGQATLFTCGSYTANAKSIMVQGTGPACFH